MYMQTHKCMCVYLSVLQNVLGEKLLTSLPAVEAVTVICHQEGEIIIRLIWYVCMYVCTHVSMYVFRCILN